MYNLFINNTVLFAGAQKKENNRKKKRNIDNLYWRIFVLQQVSLKWFVANIFNRHGEFAIFSVDLLYIDILAYV